MINETYTSTEEKAAQLYDRFCSRASKDDEFSDWAGYRAELTRFVINHTRSGGSLLILGAGKCNDLDLAKLSDHCGSITLSDYRPETAEDALCRYGITASAASERVTFLEADYVGIPDSAYLRYTELLLEIMKKLRDEQGDSLEEIAGQELQKLQTCLEQIYQDNEAYEIDLGEAAFDYGVIEGVHSQLNNSFRGLFQYVRKDVEDQAGEVKYAEDLNAAIFAVTRRHTKKIVLRFNEAVFAAVREGLIYGYEKNIIYTPEGADHPTIGTVDGARQAGEVINELSAEDRMSCLWPLSRRRGIKFEMEVRYLSAMNLSR
ncbi:MAG: hypothetical protein E7221_02160 [Clostridiales bacterium]|nr:hypothetical protein [Clostridiales bacterium]